MGDVKWIRLSIDMFNNAKIKYLRTLPEGNNIILIWVMLLTIGGRCNANGFIFLTENVPYTPKILADELCFDESVIILSLNVLAKLNMIQQIDDLISITGWDEHQNSIGLEKIREQNRVRKQKQRANERKLIECHVTSHVNVTQSHATEIELEKEIDKDIKNKKNSRFTPPSLEEVQQYCNERNNGIDSEAFIAFYESKGWRVGNQPMKNWKSAVVTWEKRNMKSKPQQPQKSSNRFNQFPQRTYTADQYSELEKKLINRQMED